MRTKPIRTRDWVTSGEIASALRVHRTTIVAYMERRKDPLPFIQPSGRNGQRKVLKRDLDLWIARQEAGSLSTGLSLKKIPSIAPVVPNGLERVREYRNKGITVAEIEAQNVVADCKGNFALLLRAVKCWVNTGDVEQVRFVLDGITIQRTLDIINSRIFQQCAARFLCREDIGSKGLLAYVAEKALNVLDECMESPADSVRLQAVKIVVSIIGRKNPLDVKEKDDGIEALSNDALDEIKRASDDMEVVRKWGGEGKDQPEVPAEEVKHDV